MFYKIINIGGKVVNNYLIVTEKGCIAIDTGYAGGFDKFADRLLKSGLHIPDIKYIFLTHAHDDHAGFLNDLMNATNAPVVLHKDAVNRLKKGQNSFDGGCTSRKALTACKILTLFGKGKHLFPSIDVSRHAITVTQNDQPFRELELNAKVMLLPGHTIDSIGLLFEDGVLFCGDAAMTGPLMAARHPIWLENLDDHFRTWDAMIESNAKVIYSGHGNPFPVTDLTRFRHYMDGKKLYPLKEY